MRAKFVLVIPAMLSVLLFSPGCKRPANETSVDNSGSQSTPRRTSARLPVFRTKGGYFQTQFEDESQFIVEAVVTDLAEQLYYAKNHRLPDAKAFSVHATEEPQSTFAEPVYALHIVFAADHAPFQTELKIAGPIWSPGVYENLTTMLAGEVGLVAAPQTAQGDDTTLLQSLVNNTASTIENQDKKLSEAMETDFTNPGLHEKAALLLGAFALREHSGAFYDIRSPLCRLTAHLCMARYLGGGKPSGINGRIARVMLLTLMNNEAPALKELAGFGNDDPAAGEWTRALQAFNSKDYRPLAKENGATPVERIAWFRAFGSSADVNLGWNKLTDTEKRTPDFVRVANELNYSVETGHQLLRLSSALELNEIATVYEWSHGSKLRKEDLVRELNQMPERCFSADSNGSQHVRVIGWGQWAMFFQRQLGHALRQNFYFLQFLWGVPEEAAKFSSAIDRTFDGMRLYPFVRRFNCLDRKSYHASVDEGFKVTVATPHLVPAECWNYLCYQGPSNELYSPNPNPHVNEWHRHNPPPGTAYNPYPRLNHPSLINRPDTSKLMADLHLLAPYDRDISGYIQRVDYKGRPTYDQAEALFHDSLPFDVLAMVAVGETLRDNPARYEELISRAAEFSPRYYFELGDYFRNKRQPDTAAGYYEKGSETGPDAVTISYYAEWLVRYYLKKGETQKAQSVADAAGEVYSSPGLQAKGTFFELTGNYPEAFKWFSKTEKRYNQPDPVAGFCVRFKNKTGDGKYDSELKARLGGLFPDGFEKVSIKDFKSPASNGVRIKAANDAVREGGLKVGDIIVAVSGVRVHNLNQYLRARYFAEGEDLDLIVWRGGYMEIKAAPLNRSFGHGAEFVDYASR